MHANGCVRVCVFVNENMQFVPMFVSFGVSVDPSMCTCVYMYSVCMRVLCLHPYYPNRG